MTKVNTDKNVKAGAEKTADLKDLNKGEAKGEKTTEKVVKVDIIRGRMPLPIVAMIKFGDAGLTDGAMAAKFRTTNGKVSDIRKDRNFGYVEASYAPSAEMIEKAKEYAGQLEDKTVLEKVETLKPATEDQAKAFDKARKDARPAKKEAPAKAEGAKTEGVEATAEDLAGLTE